MNAPTAFSVAAPLRNRPPVSAAPAPPPASRLFVCTSSPHPPLPPVWRMKRPRPVSPMPTARPGPPPRSDPRLSSSSPPPAHSPSPSHSPSPQQAAAAAEAAASPLDRLNLADPIPLSPLERNLFALLADVAAQPSVPDVTLRVAGGWVRDKILFPARDLGTSVDIDVALDTMLGNQFAEEINAYLAANNMVRGSIGLIQKNPDQSKHLETATMRVMGLCIDLVNLRTETYTHDSRIPDVHIGTPHEDAARRDLTINALFYNINTRSLEDFTSRGFDDIRARIIRTPLPPLTTLLDDPLRALRAIRFAARLNFSFDPPLYAACGHPDVHNALSAKVSRERVSAEVTRMLADSYPPHAIALLAELGLFPLVFVLPATDTLHSAPHSAADIPALSLSALLNLHALPHTEKCPAPAPLVRFAALLSPMASASCMHSEKPGKRAKLVPVAQYVLRVQLRLSANESTAVCALLSSALALQTLVHRGDERLDRLETAKALKAAGSNWRSALRIALVMELPQLKPPSSFATVSEETEKRPELSDDAKALIKKYHDFMAKVEEMGLEGSWNVRPVVNGNELFKLLPKLKKGPQVGIIMKDQVDWMLQNPSKTEDEVRTWLAQTYSHLRGTGA